MARYAPVAPTKLLAKLRRESPNTFGLYHLSLAPDILALPNYYSNLYPRDAFVIMDNSMIELGHPMEAVDLIKAASYINPRCIILPDVRGESEHTFELSMRAASELKPLGIPYMAVPQGRTLVQYVRSAARLGNLPGVKFFGIGRTTVEDLGS